MGKKGSEKVSVGRQIGKAQAKKKKEWLRERERDRQTVR